MKHGSSCLARREIAVRAHEDAWGFRRLKVYPKSFSILTCRAIRALTAFFCERILAPIDASLEKECSRDLGPKVSVLQFALREDFFQQRLSNLALMTRCYKFQTAVLQTETLLKLGHPLQCQWHADKGNEPSSKGLDEGVPGHRASKTKRRNKEGAAVMGGAQGHLRRRGIAGLEALYLDSHSLRSRFPASGTCPSGIARKGLR